MEICDDGTGRFLRHIFIQFLIGSRGFHSSPILDSGYWPPVTDHHFLTAASDERVESDAASV